MEARSPCEFIGGRDTPLCEFIGGRGVPLGNNLVDTLSLSSDRKAHLKFDPTALVIGVSGVPIEDSSVNTLALSSDWKVISPRKVDGRAHLRAGPH